MLHKVCKHQSGTLKKYWHTGNLSFPTWADQMESASLSIQHLGSMIQHEARCGCRVLDQTSNPGSHGSMLFLMSFCWVSQSVYEFLVVGDVLGKAHWICSTESPSLTWSWSPFSKRLGSAHDDCCAAIDLERSSSSEDWPTAYCGKRRSTRYQHHPKPVFSLSRIDAPIDNMIIHDHSNILNRRELLPLNSQFHQPA